MDKVWVKDIVIGGRLSSVFRAAQRLVLNGRNGKTFLKVVLVDRTGTLEARAWNDPETVAGTFADGDLVAVEGQVVEFKGSPQLTLDTITKAEPGALTEEDLTPPTPAPVEPIVRKEGTSPGLVHVDSIRREAERVQDPHVRALLHAFLEDPAIAAELARAPAARSIHHAYPGGLAEHLHSCMRLAQRLADHYPMVDRDLLVAGALLHDLGKISEYTVEHGEVVHTDEGKLVGHLVRMAQWIHVKARAITGFPQELEDHLVHLVLAHHGSKAFGSPKEPMTLEAYLVHQLDEIDSRMNSMLAQMGRGNQGATWTKPERPYEQELFRAAVPTEGGRRRGPPGKGFRGAARPPRPRREREERRPHAEGADKPIVETLHADRPAVDRPPRPERPPRPPRGERPHGDRPAGDRPHADRPERPAGDRPHGDRPDRSAKKPEAKLTFKPFEQLAAAEPAPAPTEPAPSSPEPVTEG